MLDFRTDASWLGIIKRKVHLRSGFGAWLCSALGALVLMWPHLASAHKASDAYLQWRQEGQLVALRWDVAVRDLQALMPLDSNDDGVITWGEIKAHQAEIDGYMLSHLRLQVASDPQTPERHAKTCNLRPAAISSTAISSTQGAAPLERRGDGAYYVLRMTASCPASAKALQISYRFMQEVDPTHRGLLSGHNGSELPVALVPDGRLVTLQGAPARLSMLDAPTRQLSMQPLQQGSAVRRVSYVPEIAATPKTMPTPSMAKVEAAAPASSWQLLKDGVHHILIGTDHGLFLICLLLPAVLMRTDGQPGLAALVPVPRARQALLPVLGAVTMFTVAHSITLGLAGLGWVHLPPRLVEPSIALTIALAAIDNVKPIFQGRRHLFTFLFGLVHGFGFAGVLSELNLPTSGFAWALLEFNLGVEVGQLLVLLPVMVVLLPLRHWKAYPRQFMPAASMSALLVAVGWWVERVFDLGFMPI